jgi:hypothetical protein
MADNTQDSGVPANTGVQPPTVAEHDGWEVHSASAVDQPKPEEIIERLTDVPGDEQIEQKAKQAADADKAQDATAEDAATEEREAKTDKPATDEQKKGKSASERNAELRARIAAETRAYHDARRAREFEQQEILRLRQEKEQLQRQSKPAEKPPAAKPTWAKYEEAGKSYEEFLDDRAEYDRQQTIALTRQEIEQRERTSYERARAAEQQSAIDQHAQAHDKRINDAAQKHEDFFEVVQKNLSDIPDNPFLVDVIQHHEQGAEILYHLAHNPDEARVLSTLKMSQPVGDAICLSDTPVELLSHFAQYPQELDRLNHMHPATALVALGELKARIVTAKDGSVTTEISNAKPPIKPVGGGRSSTQKNPDDLPFGPEWIRRENQREREKKKTSAYF